MAPIQLERCQCNIRNVETVGTGTPSAEFDFEIRIAKRNRRADRVGSSDSGCVEGIGCANDAERDVEVETQVYFPLQDGRSNTARLPIEAARDRQSGVGRNRHEDVSHQAREVEARAAFRCRCRSGRKNHRHHDCAENRTT